MIFILLSELVGPSVAEDFAIEGIACDSRRIKPGYLFVCIEGEKDSGYKYIDEAERRGAIGIIAQNRIESSIPVILCHNPRKKMAEIAKKIYDVADDFKFIGVTGTNGKTTVTHLIRDVLMSAGINTALIGTNGCYFNNIKESDMTFTTSTTPESSELWKILKKMHDKGAKVCVMEVSSHALSSYRVFGMEFDIGVFTNLTEDHLDFHKNMQNYFEAKKRLFEMSKFCIINTDDEYGKRIYEEYYKKAVSIGFGSCDLRAEEIEYFPDSTRFDIVEDEKRQSVTVGIAGEFSVYNSLCAYAVCKKLQISDAVIKKALANTKGVLGRVERIDLGTDYNIIIDYAHTPDGMEKIINAVKSFTKGKIITVFGCGGNRDKTKRPIMGRISAILSDFTVITSDNPRFEDPLDIICDIEKGVVEVGGSYTKITSRYDAIKYALGIAKEGDTVLLLGKGHEDYIIQKNKKIHFDEREIIKSILNI